MKIKFTADMKFCRPLRGFSFFFPLIHTCEYMTFTPYNKYSQDTIYTYLKKNLVYRIEKLLSILIIY